jgi:hypothetical protein
MSQDKFGAARCQAYRNSGAPNQHRKGILSCKSCHPVQEDQRNYLKLSWKSTTYVSLMTFHHHEDTRRKTEAGAQGHYALAARPRKDHIEINFLRRALCGLL